MPGNFKDEDVRIQKTKEALTEAMSQLLDRRNFNQITVNDLCEQAQIGRTTFYSHYQDKFDLLKYWLSKMKSPVASEDAAYKDTNKRIMDFLNNNDRIIRHLTEGANSETFELLCDFVLSLLDMDKAGDTQICSTYTVLSKFCSGGIMNYLQWQATYKPKTDSKVMNSYFYDILRILHKWYEEHE